VTTTISIQVGALSASRVFANDVKARDTLLAFYNAYELGPETATNQQKLQEVVNWIVVAIRQKAVLKYIEDQRDDSELEAGGLYGFE
jgi:hypothetical protein